MTEQSTLSGGKKRTLHDQIVRDLRTRILSGKWQPGHRIPFEVDLARQYDCSRMTVNKALTQLANAGLIERRRRAGSRVAHPRAQSAILEIRDIQSEVQSLGLAYTYRLLERDVRQVRAADRAHLRLPSRGSVLDVTCIHFAAAWPFCLEQRIINLKAVPEAREEGFENVAPGQWLLGRVLWSAAEHVIRSVAADEEVADKLNMMVGAPCLVVERRTSRDDANITFVRLTYPGESHELLARFAPSELSSRPRC
jgi:GntR family transcriptional regulator, histidine utilization repressor